MTEPSYFLVERVLHNSVNVMKRQREEQGITEYPLYHHREVDELSFLFQGFRYGHVEPWGQFDADTAGDSPTILSPRRPCTGLGGVAGRTRARKSLLHRGRLFS